MASQSNLVADAMIKFILTNFAGAANLASTFAGLPFRKEGTQDITCVGIVGQGWDSVLTFIGEGLNIYYYFPQLFSPIFSNVILGSP